MSGLRITFENSISSLAGAAVLFAAKKSSEQKLNVKIRIMESIALSSLADLGSVFYDNNNHNQTILAKVCIIEAGAVLLAAYFRNPLLFIELQSYPLGKLALHAAKKGGNPLIAEVILNSGISLLGGAVLKVVKIGSSLNFQIKVAQTIIISSLFTLACRIYTSKASSESYPLKNIIFIESCAVLLTLFSRKKISFLEFQIYSSGVFVSWIAFKLGIGRYILKKINISFEPSEWEKSLENAVFSNKQTDENLEKIRVRFLSIQLRIFIEKNKYLSSEELITKLKDRFLNLSNEEILSLLTNDKTGPTAYEAAKELLEIKTGIKDKSDIERPWKQLCLCTHSDKNQSPDANEFFELISRAKEFLLCYHKFK